MKTVGVARSSLNPRLLFLRWLRHPVQLRRTTKTFPISDDDVPISKIDIFDAQTKGFHDAKA